MNLLKLNGLSPPPSAIFVAYDNTIDTIDAITAITQFQLEGKNMTPTMLMGRAGFFLTDICSN